MKGRFDKIQSCIPPKQQVSWNAQELFDDLIKALPKILETRSVFIYVDGVNYSEGETAPKLVHDFTMLVEKSQIPTREPHTIHELRVIFSSTVYTVKAPFPRPYVSIDEKNGPNLKRYLEGQFSNMDLNTQRLVSTKSGSSFISARLIANHIKLFGPGQSSLVRQPSPTPAPISFLLGVYFQDMAHQGTNGLLSLLKWCCLSTKPLTLVELRVALALDVAKITSIKDFSQTEYFTRFGSDESFQSWIKTTSWGLLETVAVGGQKVVKPMHDSVSDFFISKGLDVLCCKDQVPSATTSPLQQTHHSIAICLLRYLALLPKEPRWESMARTDSALRLVGYAAANWSHHITAAGLGKTEASKILKLLGWPSDQTLNLLVKLGQETSAHGNLQGTLWTHLFAIYGHANFLSVAVRKAGNDVLDVQDRQKRTPLHLAALHGHSTVSKQLLKSGARTNGQAVSGNTALHFAVLQGHQSIMKYLLERDPNLISVADGQSQTPLFSAVFCGSSSAIKLLLDRRADLRAYDTHGNSVLHHAVNTEKSSVLKLLLDGGTDINRQNAQGRTPLHIATVGDHSSAVKALLEKRSRTDIGDNLGRKALHEAVLSGNKACTQLLLKHRVSVDARDKDGQTALAYAIQGRHGSILKLLLEGGTDINSMDKSGYTMIMVAVLVSEEKLTRILLEKNPDLDRLSREGHTVAFYAVFRGKAVSFLSEEEQSIASLLFRRYQKRYQVWHPEWKECQQEFMAKHGKKKDSASKTRTKLKPPKTKNAPLPSNTDPASKPPKSLRSSKVIANMPTKVPSSVPNPRSAEPKGLQEVQEHPRPTAQSEAANKPQSSIQSQSRPQATTNTPSPLGPSSSVPKISPEVQQSLMSTLKNSSATSVKPEMQQVRPVSSFATYQPLQILRGSESGGVSVPGAKAKEQPTKPTQTPYPGSTSPGQAKAPMVQRGSWDLYSSLASGSPVPQMVQSQKASIPCSGSPQTSPGATPASTQYFQPFQPFVSGQSQKLSSATAPASSNQFEKRYSVSSLNSWGQPGSAGPGSSSPASQKAPAQAYQPFVTTPQKPSTPQQQVQTSYQNSADQVPVAKPPVPQVVRKPVGGKPAMQPAAEKPSQRSSFLPWQQPQTPAGTTKSPPGPPHAKPQTKPQAQSGKPAPVPPKSQTPAGAVQPQPAKPLAQNVKPESQGHKMQGPPGTTQTPPTKPQNRSSLPSQKPQTPAQKAQVQAGSPVQKQPGNPKPAVATSAKPSAAPGQSEKPTPSQRKAIPSQTAPGPGGAKSPASVLGQVSSGQKPYQYIDKHSTTPSTPLHPESLSRGHYGEQTQTTTFTSSREFINSDEPNAQQKENMSGGKVAAAAGLGVLAGAAGGYYLSSEIHENYSSSSVADDNSYVHMNTSMSQQSTYDSDQEPETHVEFSDHSEEFSESDNEVNSINGSDSDGLLSEGEFKVSDSEVSEGQVSSDDEISDWEESDVESIHEGSDSDSDSDDLDSPYMSSEFTDNETSEAEDLGVRDLGAESDSDLNTDPGQASAEEDSDSDEKESVNNESEDEMDDESEEEESYQQQYQQQGYYSGQHQQEATQQYESEDEGQQSARGFGNYESEQEVESYQDVDNGYSSDEQGQQSTNASGQYSGGGWGNNYDSDY
ncbi:hypothetical protein IL306_013537 [Fusarium sp. DS 682]|nr:hypothetical protein IL306_013537 [Fusarium sp. DS 682]